MCEFGSVLERETQQDCEHAQQRNPCWEGLRGGRGVETGVLRGRQKKRFTAALVYTSARMQTQWQPLRILHSHTGWKGMLTCDESFLQSDWNSDRRGRSKSEHVYTQETTLIRLKQEIEQCFHMSWDGLQRISLVNNLIFPTLYATFLNHDGQILIFSIWYLNIKRCRFKRFSFFSVLDWSTDTGRTSFERSQLFLLCICVWFLQIAQCLTMEINLFSGFWFKLNQYNFAEFQSEIGFNSFEWTGAQLSFPFIVSSVLSRQWYFVTYVNHQQAFKEAGYVCTWLNKQKSNCLLGFLVILRSCACELRGRSIRLVIASFVKTHSPQQLDRILSHHNGLSKGCRPALLFKKMGHAFMNLSTSDACQIWEWTSLSDYILGMVLYWEMMRLP